MNLGKKIIILILSAFVCGESFAQVYSFEDGMVPAEWNINNGKISVTDKKHKLGVNSLKVNWKPKSVICFTNASGLEIASKSKNGGITAWIYNENPIIKPLIFSFLDKSKKEVCQLPFSMNFSGWRCVWAKFREDMNMDTNALVSQLNIIMPDGVKGGNIYFDHVEFTPNVSWQKMSDAQYRVNQKDYSLIHNFVGYRNTQVDLSGVTVSRDEIKAAQEISERLTEWYLGRGNYEDNSLVKIRKNAEKKYINKGVKEALPIRCLYDENHIPIGNGLYPMYAPSVIDGQKVYSFMDINKNVLLPLALNYRKNNNEESLRKAQFIYDWFNDQGWADGSGMGTLCFEKLRSSGYFHSFFLLKDKLSASQRERELKTFNWLTMFGTCYQNPSHVGEVADNLRALALPKLIYALSLSDEKERCAALSAFSAYMNNSLAIAPGYFGVIKSDFSGYHHRGTYNSAYYPHALYASSLIAYLLHDTPYALSQAALDNLKNALLTFRFLSANLDVPAGTSGRFPDKRTVLQELLPAFSYVAYSSKAVDKELIAACKNLMENNREVMESFAGNVNSNLAYTSSLGEAEMMARAYSSDVIPEKTPTGSLFMPYSGLLIVKDNDHQFNIKGFSKYIWDFESSSSENIYGRYTSYGQIEHIDLHSGISSFNPSSSSFNWNYIPGTTSKVLPLNVLGAKNASHRNFSDESFLCGVGISSKKAMFSFKLHDNTFDKSFRANKSVFIIDGALLCLGSDIENRDVNNKTVTTLFQSSMNKVELKESDSGSLLTDRSGVIYVVKEAKVSSINTDSFSVAYINHGSAPVNASYQYYMIPDKDVRKAELFLSKKNPIHIIQQDSVAHIVNNAIDGTIYAAIFNSQRLFSALPVQKVNIPLSYIWEKESATRMKLSFCEPDMRRASAPGMDLLTEEDVLQTEKPFNTTLTIKGKYNVDCADSLVNVRYTDDCTLVEISTIRGKNYTLNLSGK